MLFLLLFICLFTLDTICYYYLLFVIHFRTFCSEGKKRVGIEERPRVSSHNSTSLPSVASQYLSYCLRFIPFSFSLLVSGDRGSVSIVRMASFASAERDLAKWASSRRSKKLSVERDESGVALMTPTTLQCIALDNNGFETPALNDKLYLHFKGFRKIENLGAYENLKCLWLESNGIETIENLDHLRKLKCLYLQQNVISRMVGIEGLKNLTVLHLGNNRISKIEGIQALKQLTNLNVSHNALKTPEDVAELRGHCRLSNLDISANDISSADTLDVFQAIPNLSVLLLKGNPIVRSTKHYRKTVLVNMPKLAYLDERPVFELDRVCANAWAEGGADAEKTARKEFNEAKKASAQQHTSRWREWKKEQREKRLKQIEEAKKEGKELPKRKVYVSYKSVDDAEEQRRQDVKRALARAETKAEKMNIVGEGVQMMGREFAEACGAAFDNEGVLEAEVEKISKLGEMSSTVETETEAAAVIAAAQPSSPQVTPLTESGDATATSPEQENDDKEAEARKWRVEESYRIYKEQKLEKERRRAKETEKARLEAATVPACAPQAPPAPPPPVNLDNATNVDDSCAEEWSNGMNAFLCKLVEDHAFDFDQVAKAMANALATKSIADVKHCTPVNAGRDFDATTCRLRFAAVNKFRKESERLGRRRPPKKGDLPPLTFEVSASGREDAKAIATSPPVLTFKKEQQAKPEAEPILRPQPQMQTETPPSFDHLHHEPMGRPMPKVKIEAPDMFPSSIDSDDNDEDDSPAKPLSRQEIIAALHGNASHPLARIETDVESID